MGGGGRNPGFFFLFSMSPSFYVTETTPILLSIFNSAKKKAPGFFMKGFLRGGIHRGIKILFAVGNTDLWNASLKFILRNMRRRFFSPFF